VGDGSAGVVWFSMPGFRVLEVDERASDVVISVETTVDRLACPVCGVFAWSKGRRWVTLRDAPSGHRPVTIRWWKRIGECGESACSMGSWTEQRPEFVLPGRVLTQRACQWATHRIAAIEATPASAARVLGVTWSTVWAAVARDGVVVESHSAVQVGFDETVMSPARLRRRRRFVTAAVDLDSGEILDVFDGRAADDVQGWLATQPEEWVAGIETVCTDLHASYRSAVRRSALAKATLVVDPFHVVRVANEAVTKCRARVQHAVHGHRGRRGDPLYANRKLLLIGAERLDQSGWDRLWDTFDDELLEVWAGKELVRDIYLTDDPAEAAFRLDTAIEWCADPDAPTELAALEMTLRKWRREILAHHATGASNGRVEAANVTIKNVKRSGRGFRNLTNYRHRILLASQHPRHAHDVTRHRARPRALA
jgi:transposase